MSATNKKADQSDGARGKRAEKVAAWYFRLNGFLTTAGFVIHGDRPRQPVSEADLVAVRSPYTSEFIHDIRVVDDRWVQGCCGGERTVFVIAEVKATKRCDINEAWRIRESLAMLSMVRRLGFAKEGEIAAIAKAMHDRLKWTNDLFTLQYVAVGSKVNQKYLERYPDLVQLTWKDIAAFLWDRFSAFGPMKGCPNQWPRFGRKYAKAVQQKHVADISRSGDAVSQFIKSGKIELPPASV